MVLLDGGFSSRGQDTSLMALTSVQIDTLQDAAPKVRSMNEFKFLGWFIFGCLGLLFTVMAKGVSSVVS